MNKREEAALHRRVEALERGTRTDRGISESARNKLLEARTFVAAVRRILIQKNVCTAAEFDAAVAFIRSQGGP